MCFILFIKYIYWTVKKGKSHEINNDKNFQLVSGHARPQGITFQNVKLPNSTY